VTEHTHLFRPRPGQVRCDCGAQPPVLARCPGCGEPTEPVTLVEGSGASAEVHTSDAWCRACLAAKVAAARAEGTCHCSQVPGPHTHALPR
jgi:hypothetical protein